MSRTDLLPSICLSALLAVSTTGAAVAASPMPKPVLLPVVRVINQKPEAPAAEPAAPAAEPAAPAAPAAPAPTSGADFGFDIQIPTVATVNSSMSATELTRALSGGLASEADKLATLNATSIRIPKITATLTLPGPEGQAPRKSVFTYSDIDLENVSNGVAQSFTVGGTAGTEEVGSETSPQTAQFKTGKFSLEDVDIGASLGVFGFGPDRTGTTVKPLYKNFSLAGGTFSAPDVACSFGAITIATASARPLKVNFSDLMRLLGSPDLQSKHPSPETITKLAVFYADLFSALQSSPLTYDGFDCTGTDTDKQAFSFKTGPLKIGGFGNDRYPAVTLSNFAFSGASGTLGFDSVTMKGMDLSGPIKLIESAAKPLTEEWFTAHARDLIPAFEGFALSGLKMDVPDSQNAGERIKGGVADFDLTLGDYLDGVPARISTYAHHVTFDVPPAIAGKTDDYEVLRQAGLSRFDVGYDFAVHRDAPSKSLIVDKLGVTGVDLGSAALAATLGNVDDLLFATDVNSATGAAMAMTFQSAKLDVTDAGLGDIIFKEMAKEQHMDVGAARTSVSNMAQALILAGLASNPDAKALGNAVGQFLAAAGRSLSIGVSAKDPAGIPMGEFAAASDNPQALTAKISISASAH